ncbi:ArsR/SmtB family transcription factor [Deinococcus roseus]|uniref:Transcriptional regulator n=1 Tax=Deinococcus roseus TaxID=392414 RepID=A0ABQ2D2J9_9DEIO|nr:metalloregulator ArsR/SmtB family transcription factor [Deinococcus roseus]GGJ41743.1 transcriptional regulator [Deinococcus roseus]
MDEVLLKLKALADPTRLKIIGLLRSICDKKDSEPQDPQDPTSYGISISQSLGLTQPTVSHHMKVLVEAGLVKATREGNTVYYSLNGEGFKPLTQFLEHHQNAPTCD